MKTYKEVYQLPLEDQHGWIYDQKGNFVFQFLIDNEEMEKVYNLLLVGFIRCGKLKVTTDVLEYLLSKKQI